MFAKKEEPAQFVNNRQSALEKDKQPWEALLQDVADYVNPVREDIKGNIQSGSKQGIKIYDGTAVSAAVLATDGIHGYHVSPAFQWFKYVMNRLNLNNLPAVKEWLEEIEYNMYMVLNRSNFYSEMWPYIFDGETMGTAAIIAEEDIGDGRIIFEAVHFGEIYISENKYGEADVLHRKRKITARQMVQMFGISMPGMAGAQGGGSGVGRRRGGVRFGDRGVGFGVATWLISRKFSS